MIVSDKYTLTYSIFGNILSKTGVGTYTYGSTKPHAVKDVTDPAFNPPTLSLQFAKKRKWMWKDKKQWKENKKKRKEDWRNSPYYTKFHL